MNQSRVVKRLLVASVLALGSQGLGCAKWSGRLQNCLPMGCAEKPPQAAVIRTEQCADLLPDASVPSPPGTYVQAWQSAMASQADQQQYLITRNLWFNGGNQLGPDGQKLLMAVATRLQCQPGMVVIEEEPMEPQTDQTYDEAFSSTIALNNRRRAVIIEGLSALDAGIPPEWIVFTSDRSVGVKGVEAPAVFNRQFNTQRNGNRGGIGQGGLGGQGFGGFGGGFGGAGGFF